MLTQARLDLLRRMAEQAMRSDMDVALGANVVIALVNEIEQLKRSISQGRKAARRAIETLDTEGLEDCDAVRDLQIFLH